MLFRDRLVYLGDQVRFALGREQVERVFLGKSAAEPWYPQRVYVTWRDETGNAIIHNFGYVDGRSLWSLRRAIPVLLQRIERWHAGDEDQREIPPALNELSPPKLGEVSSLRLRDCVNLRGLIQMLLFLSLLSSGAAYVVGLSFQFPSGSGWQAVYATGLTFLLTQIPLFLYRESPKNSATQ